MKKSILNLKNKTTHILIKFWLSTVEKASDSEPQFIPFGMIGFFGFASYYFVWHDLTPGSYENISLRFIAMVFCLGLILKKYWPKKIQSFLPIYWYITLIYVLPFFFSFMTLKNNFSTVWVQNSMGALLYLVLLVDWSIFIILLIIGVFTGYLFYFLTTTDIQNNQNTLSVLLAYIGPALAAILIHNRDNIVKNKIASMSTLSASIAHELRTPFAALSLASSGMRKYFNNLIEGYKLAKQANLPVSSINTTQLELLEKIPETIDRESKAANLFIDLLINNINPDIRKETNNFVSINTCIKQSLERYPFSEEQRSLIHWQNNNDFTFKGDEILIIHLLFNLIKNALYYLAKAGKKSEKGIYIWTEKTASGNKLYFKDTGTGIAKDTLPFIFNRFFSKTKHGSGIGLTYCKMVMESLGGSMSCESEINDYTLFIMTFPVINN